MTTTANDALLKKCEYETPQPYQNCAFHFAENETDVNKVLNMYAKATDFQNQTKQTDSETFLVVENDGTLKGYQLTYGSVEKDDQYSITANVEEGLDAIEMYRNFEPFHACDFEGETQGTCSYDIVDMPEGVYVTKIIGTSGDYHWTNVYTKSEGNSDEDPPNDDGMMEDDPFMEQEPAPEPENAMEGEGVTEDDSMMMEDDSMMDDGMMEEPPETYVPPRLPEETEEPMDEELPEEI